jgi:hypothetical protein
VPATDVTSRTDGQVVLNEQLELIEALGRADGASSVSSCGRDDFADCFEAREQHLT